MGATGPNKGGMDKIVPPLFPLFHGLCKMRWFKKLSEKRGRRNVAISSAVLNVGSMALLSAPVFYRIRLATLRVLWVCISVDVSPKFL